MERNHSSPLNAEREVVRACMDHLDLLLLVCMRAGQKKKPYNIQIILSWKE